MGMVSDFYPKENTVVKKALVKVNGVQADQQGIVLDRVEVQTDGKVYFEDDAVYVIYKETEITGMAGTTTVLRVSENLMELKRNGSVNTQMIFEKGKSSSSMYDSEEGSLMMTIETDTLETTVTDKGLCVELEYDVSINDMFLTRNLLTATILYK